MLVEEQAPPAWMEDEKDDFNAGVNISANFLVISFAVGMMVYNGLVLPVMGIEAGWFTSTWVVLFMGFTSYYTASLIVSHLGKGKSMKTSILAHFRGDYRYMTAYSIINALSFIPLIFLNFNFICLEIEDIMGYSSTWVPIILALAFIFGTIILRVLHYAEESMGFGIIGLVLFAIFLIYAHITAPAGPKRVEPNGNFIILASSLITMLELHNFLAENIIKHHNKENYQGILKKAYIIATLYYLFSTLGSFSIINRTPHVQPAQVINDYFANNSAINIVIEILYALVTISITPNFLLVSMIRFYQVFKVDLHAHITFKEVAYIVILYAASCGVFLSGVKLDTLFSLNGAVLGYIYIIIAPIWMHFKCIYYDHQSGQIQGDDEWNSRIKANACQCDPKYSSKWKLYLQTFYLIFVLVMGLGLLIATVHKELYKSK